jgi:hypothetical protein
VNHPLTRRPITTTTALAAAAIAATLCAACTPQPAPHPTIPTITPDSYLPAHRTTPPHTPAAPNAATTTTTPRPATLSQIQPCELLNDQQIDLYRYTEIHAVNDETPRTCTYTGRGSEYGEAGGRQLIITFAADNIDSLHPDATDTVIAFTLAGRYAVQAESTRLPMCTIYLSVSDKTAVTVQSLDHHTSDTACAHASDVALLIEPALP